MDDYEGDLDRLETQFTQLEDTIGNLGGVAAAFQKELTGVQSTFSSTGREASGMSRSVAASFRSAIEGVMFDGAKLSDALSRMGRSVANSVVNHAVSPVQDAVGSSVSKSIQSILGGMMPFAVGGVLSGGRVAAFARGGVVDRPTQFPMRGGAGLMGEAGPEAIMPLARGMDGRLGVRTSGGGSINVTMNVTTPDVAGFRKSQGQIAAEMTRALQRGRRNL
jgi:lambda family phage tail tape measure protein